MGAFAMGAFAVGALAIGALAIGRLAIAKARIRQLQIDELTVKKLHVVEQIPPLESDATDGNTPQKPGRSRRNSAAADATPPSSGS